MPEQKVAQIMKIVRNTESIDVYFRYVKDGREFETNRSVIDPTLLTMTDSDLEAWATLVINEE